MTVPAWKIATTLILGDSISSGLKKSNMSQKNLKKIELSLGPKFRI